MSENPTGLLSAEEAAAALAMADLDVDEYAFKAAIQKACLQPTSDNNDATTTEGQGSTETQIQFDRWVHSLVHDVGVHQMASVLAERYGLFSTGRASMQREHSLMAGSFFDSTSIAMENSSHNGRPPHLKTMNNFRAVGEEFDEKSDEYVRRSQSQGKAPGQSINSRQDMMLTLPPLPSQHSKYSTASSVHALAKKRRKKGDSVESTFSNKELQSIAGFDQSFGRQTPRCLREGSTRNNGAVERAGSMSAIDELRRELRLAEEGLNRLDNIVEDNIAWVQSNCDVGANFDMSKRAKAKCRKICAERLTDVLMNSAFVRMSSAFRKWRLLFQFTDMIVIVRSYSRIKSVQMFANAIGRIVYRLKQKTMTRWTRAVNIMRRFEQEAALVEIQRIVRGRLGKLKSKKRLVEIEAQTRNKAARDIQKIARGKQGRKRFKEKWREHKHHWAVAYLQHWSKTRLAIQRAKDITNERRLHRKSATKVQKVVRGRLGRRRFQDIKTKKEMENKMVSSTSTLSRFFRRSKETKSERDLLKQKNTEIEDKKKNMFSQGLSAMSQAFSSKLSGKGDDAPSDNNNDIDRHEFGEDVDKAAIKLQAVTRGRLGRKKSQRFKTFEKTNEEPKGEPVETSADARATKDQADLDVAAMKLQAVSRGRLARRDSERKKAEQKKGGFSFFSRKRDGEESKQESVKISDQSSEIPDIVFSGKKTVPAHADSPKQIQSIALQEPVKTPTATETLKKEVKNIKSAIAEESPKKEQQKLRKNDPDIAKPVTPQKSVTPVPVKEKISKVNEPVSTVKSVAAVPVKNSTSKPKESELPKTPIVNPKESAPKSTTPAKAEKSVTKATPEKALVAEKQTPGSGFVKSVSQKRTGAAASDSPRSAQKVSSKSTEKSTAAGNKGGRSNLKSTVASPDADKIVSSRPGSNTSNRGDKRSASPADRSSTKGVTVKPRSEGKDTSPPPAERAKPTRGKVDSNKHSENSDSAKVPISASKKSEKRPPSGEKRPSGRPPSPGMAPMPPKSLKESPKDIVTDDKTISASNKDQRPPAVVEVMPTVNEVPTAMLNEAAPVAVEVTNLLNEDNAAVVEKIMQEETPSEPVPTNNGANMTTTPPAGLVIKEVVVPAAKEPESLPEVVQIEKEVPIKKEVKSKPKEVAPKPTVADSPKPAHLDHEDKISKPKSSTPKSLPLKPVEVEAPATVSSVSLPMTTETETHPPSSSKPNLEIVTDEKGAISLSPPKTPSGMILSARAALSSMGSSFKRAVSPLLNARPGSTKNSRPTSRNGSLASLNYSDDNSVARSLSKDSISSGYGRGHLAKQGSRSANLSNDERMALEETKRLIEAQRKAAEYLTWAVVTIQSGFRRFLARKMAKRLAAFKKKRPKQWVTPGPDSKYFAKPKDLTRKRPIQKQTKKPKKTQPASDDEDDDDKRHKVKEAADAQAKSVAEAVAEELRLKMQKDAEAMEERIRRLEALEQAIIDRELKVSEISKQAELQAEQAREALLLIHEQQKDSEEEKKKMQHLLEMAAGPLSHRTDVMAPGVMSTGGSRRSNSSTPRRRGSKGGQLSARERGLPPTALSARGGAGVPHDATHVEYGGDDWVQLWDPDEYSWYWFNRRTQVAQWEYPGTDAADYSGNESAGGMTDYSTDGGDESGYESEYNAGSAQYGGSPWQEFWDEQAQAKYWYNEQTGEASWTRPEGVGGSRPGSARSQVLLSNDWVSYIDDETDQEYWYNAVTGETSWTPMG